MDTIGDLQSRSDAVENARPFNPLESVEIGKRIAARRKVLHMSQTELAKAMGVSRTTVSEYENGKLSISAKEIRAAMRKLGAPIEYFLGDISLEDVVRGDADFMMIESAEDILGPDEIGLLRAYGRLPDADKAKAIRIVEALYDPNTDTDHEIIIAMRDDLKN
ncbi:MAG TPA: helix-turn-helix transcriptional regulator [Capsulimonadaceae bacterium]|jgi:transcriptional regulator with XRE-family HTH domain